MQDINFQSKYLLPSVLLPGLRMPNAMLNNSGNSGYACPGLYREKVLNIYQRDFSGGPVAMTKSSQ